jgi:metal-dependent HD superfamily phosphatase/phosphodiesterase
MQHGRLRVPFERGISDLHGFGALRDRIAIAAKARFGYLGWTKVALRP